MAVPPIDREEELADVRWPMHRLEVALESGLISRIHEEDKQVVLKYNKDDCVSTAKLRDWLEKLRRNLIDSGSDIPRPPSLEQQPEEDGRSQEVKVVFENLTNGFVGKLASERTEIEKSKWLLANT